MTPVEMHLKSFGNKLEFVTESFRQNPGMPFGVHEFTAKSVGCRSDELLDLCEGFLIHDFL